MVQEFHVLRCFSCQTFQVQQVKKSKKWECKVCGEKQSVIKEYGQGAAADCRRHVQKLNSLHGELLKVNNDTVLSQWEQDKDDQNKSVIEDWNSNNKEKGATVSRWSKYIDQTTEGTKQDEEEKKEENIYTVRDQLRNKETRKRKLKSVGGCYSNFECEDSCTGFQCVNRQQYQQDGKLSSSWNNKGHLSLHDSQEDVSCTSTHLLSHPQAVYSYHTACTSYTHTLANPCEGQYNSSHNQGPFTTSSSQKFTESKHKNNNSMWNKFFTAVPTREEDDMNHHLPSSVFVDNTMMSESTEPLTDIYSEEHGSPPAGKTDTGVPGRQMSADSFYEINSHTFNSKPADFEKAVCLPTKRSCPGLSLNSLFFTDEDFDDTF